MAQDVLGELSRRNGIVKLLAEIGMAVSTDGRRVDGGMREPVRSIEGGAIRSESCRYGSLSWVAITPMAEWHACYPVPNACDFACRSGIPAGSGARIWHFNNHIENILSQDIHP